jgi:hypothetical protein
MFRSTSVFCAALTVLGVGVSPLFAQDAPPIAAGRPGATESRATVGDDVVQFEGGASWGFETGDDASPQRVSTPALVRYGIGSRFELRAGGAGWQYDSTGRADARVGTRSTSDLYVGAKVHVLDEARAGFEMNVVPGMTLPLGGDAVTSGGYDPSLTVALAHALPLGFDAAGAWSVAATTHESGHQADFTASMAVGRPLTSRLSTFGEVVRVASWHETPVVSVNSGLAFLVNGDAQVDVQVGRGVRNGSGWTLAAGVILRRR